MWGWALVIGDSVNTVTMHEALSKYNWTTGLLKIWPVIPWQVLPKYLLCVSTQWVTRQPTTWLFVWPQSGRALGNSHIFPNKMMSHDSSKKTNVGVPGWLMWLSVRLQLRSWSHGLWVHALHQALCWQLRAWSLLHILCLPLFLPLAHSHSVSLKNK